MIDFLKQIILNFDYIIFSIVVSLFLFQTYSEFKEINAISGFEPREFVKDLLQMEEEAFDLGRNNDPVELDKEAKIKILKMISEKKFEGKWNIEGNFSNLRINKGNFEIKSREILAKQRESDSSFYYEIDLFNNTPTSFISKIYNKKAISIKENSPKITVELEKPKSKRKSKGKLRKSHPKRTKDTMKIHFQLEESLASLKNSKRKFHIPSYLFNSTLKFVFSYSQSDFQIEGSLSSDSVTLNFKGKDNYPFYIKNKSLYYIGSIILLFIEMKLAKTAKTLISSHAVNAIDANSSKIP